MFIFDKHKLFFYISTSLWLRKYDGFDFSRNHTIEVSRNFLGGAPSSWFSTLASFGGHRPCECGDKTFWLEKWPRNWCVTWFCWWGPLIRSHHPVKFGMHRACESGNIAFSICRVITVLKCHLTLWLASPHPKSPID